MIKFFLRKIVMKIVCKKSNIKIDFNSNMSIKAIKATLKCKKSRKYPIKINNSYIDSIDMQEGCKIHNSICSGNIELGRFVSINGPGTRISARINKVKIGDFTSIASNVIIQEDYHNYTRPTSYFIMQNIFGESVMNDVFTKGTIEIGEDVWVGSNSTILSGVKIGRGSIIGAGSVVTKDVPKYAIVAGNPAKVIKYRFDDEIIDELEKLEWWNWNIDEIKKNKAFFNKKLSI